MCGLLFVLANEATALSTSFVSLWEQLAKTNAFRGPDAQSTQDFQAADLHGHPVLLRFFGCELHLRGSVPVMQPHCQNENVLCWNGEVFSGLDLNKDENDGTKLFAALQQTTCDQEIYTLLARIEGPYAFVYFHATSGKLWFARDPLGRRSLLYHRPTVRQPYFLLMSASIGPQEGYNLEEASTDVLYSIDVRTVDIAHFIVASMPRVSDESTFCKPCSVNRTVPAVDPPKNTSLQSIPPHLTYSVQSLIAHLEDSVRLRVQDIPPRPAGEPRVGVLFSGGIDCTVVAYLAHRFIPLDEPIDLLNVAFENPRRNAVRKHGPQGSSDSTYQVPDRLGGLEELQELQRLCPGRVWNFVEIDVPYDESQRLKTLVTSLMFPRDTVMDYSLANALYFSARGIGRIHSTNTTASAVTSRSSDPYVSPARVLLSGLGSDEMMGGYGRHRTAFTRGSWAALIEELQLELDRIPERNLGRDDRIISSHGKEARYPFLALPVVNFLARLPVEQKLDPRAELGLGDKTLLRYAAHALGLEQASHRKKKAMQFGTHSARMEGGAGDRKGDIVMSLNA